MRLDEVLKGEKWRRVRELPILPTKLLRLQSPSYERHTMYSHGFFIFIFTPTRRAHPLAHPHSRNSLSLRFEYNHLLLPPVLTYPDEVLYNWKSLPSSSQEERLPTPQNITTLTTFTPTPTEPHFYLASAHIELIGMKAVDLVQSMMDELYVSDAIAVRRIAGSLLSLSRVNDELAEMLMSVRDGCDPQAFYDNVRPWFKGEDSNSRRWVFDPIGVRAA